MKIKLILILALGIFVDSNSQSIEPIKHIPKAVIYDIVVDEGDVWAASYGNGVYQYSKKENKWYNYSTQNNKLSIDFFYCIASDGENIWAGSTDGLFIFDKKRKAWTKRKFGKGGQLGNWIRALEYDKSENAIWIGRFMYLTKYEIGSKKFIDYDLTVNKDVKTNTIKMIKTDGDSVVWFGTENGLHKYNKRLGEPNENSIFFYSNRLNYFNRDGKSISVASILFKDENVWIGLDEFLTKENPNYNLGGLYKFDRQNEWTRFDVTNGMLGNGIYDLSLIGNFIFSSTYQFSLTAKQSYGRGLVMLNLVNNQIVPVEDDSLPQNIFSLYFDGINLWLGTDKGIFQIIFQNDIINNFRNSLVKR